MQYIMHNSTDVIRNNTKNQAHETVKTYTQDGKDPEKVSNVQKTNQRATNETRKEGLKVTLT